MNQVFIRSVERNIDYWQRLILRPLSHALAALEKDWPNFYRALSVGLTIPATWSKTADLLTQTTPLIAERYFWQDYVVLLEAALARCPTDRPDQQGRLLDFLGIGYRQLGQYQTAVQCHLTEEAIGQQQNDARRLAYARLNLSETYQQLQKYDIAKEKAQQALAYFQASDDHPHEIATLHFTIGNIHRNTGSYTQALDAYNKALDIQKRLGHTRDIVSLLHNIGVAYSSLGEHKVAIVKLENAESLAISLNNIPLQAKILHQLGASYFSLGQPEQALEQFQRVDIAGLKTVGAHEDIGWTYNNLGNVYLQKEAYAIAKDYFVQSNQAFAVLGLKVEQANAIGGLAEIAETLQQFAEANRLYQKALSLISDANKSSWAQKKEQEFQKALDNLRKQL
ncbi:MAG: tetratricopeptide repeat protein [Chloroflexota bacterium]